MKKLGFLVIAVLLLTMVGCSNPPKSVVGDTGRITGAPIGYYVYIPSTPNSDIAGDLLFAYEGVVDNSYIIAFNNDNPISHYPLSCDFTVSVYRNNWFNHSGYATIELSNFTTSTNGELSLTWTRIK